MGRNLGVCTPPHGVFLVQVHKTQKILVYTDILDSQLQYNIEIWEIMITAKFIWLH